MSIITTVSNNLSRLFTGFLGDLTVGLIIVLTGFIIGRIIGKVLTRIFDDLEIDENLHNAGIELPVESIVTNFISYLIYFIAIIMALDQIGLSTAALYIIVGGIIALVLIATIISIKDFIPNISGGLFIYKNQLFSVGDTIEIKDTVGEVKDISIIETKIETRSGDIIYIPNSMMVRSELKIKNKKEKELNE